MVFGFVGVFCCCWLVDVVGVEFEWCKDFFLYECFLVCFSGLFGDVVDECVVGV